MATANLHTEGTWLFRVRLYDYNPGGFSQHIFIALSQYVFFIQTDSYYL